MNEWEAIEADFELPVYPKRGLTIVRGKGALVWDSDNIEYIDCIAGQGTANIGHCNDHVINAIKEQSEKLITCPGIFTNDLRSELLKKLVSITPESVTKVFFCNSGAEATEAAIKLTRLATGKKNIIACMRGFHGRTFGALSATHNPKIRKAFEPLVPGFSHVPYNNLEKLEAAIDDDTAGIILEVVQGEGGVHPGTEEFLKGAETLCKDKGIVFIVDEVQTGFCRTGKLFASEHFNLQPDILTLAKSMAGGLPMGAVLCSDWVSEKASQHGTTFGGTPILCAASLATIDFIEKNDLAKEASDKGEYFTNNFCNELPDSVREVRQLGLMIGIELKEKVTPVLKRLMQEKVLALPGGMNVLRLLPPAVIEYSQLDKVIAALKASL